MHQFVNGSARRARSAEPDATEDELHLRALQQAADGRQIFVTRDPAVERKVENECYPAHCRGEARCRSFEDRNRHHPNIILSDTLWVIWLYTRATFALATTAEEQMKFVKDGSSTQESES